MTTLWPALILLSLLAMLFVLVPLRRYRNLNTRSMVEQRRAKNLEVFRQRQAELEQDLQHRLTQDDEHARLVAELQRAFLADMQALDSQATATNSWQVGRPVLLALALLIPVASLMLYVERGAGPDLALPDLLQRVGAAESGEAQTATLTELAAFLQQRFERNPDDIQNGYMLGTLYIEQEQYEDAIDIFSILVDVMEDGMDKATVLGQLARSMLLADESMMTPRVRNVIERAQALNPNEYTVLTLLAMDALLNAEPEKAVGYWRRQLLQLDSGSHEAAVLRDRIDPGSL